MSKCKEAGQEEFAVGEKVLHESPQRSDHHGTIASIGVSGLATSLLHAKDAGGVKASHVSPNQQSGNGDGAERGAGESLFERDTRLLLLNGLVRDRVRVRQYNNHLGSWKLPTLSNHEFPQSVFTQLLPHPDHDFDSIPIMTILLAVLGREYEGEGDVSAQGPDVGSNRCDETAGQVPGDEPEASEVREPPKLSDDVAGGDERQRRECVCVPKLLLRKGKVITLPAGAMVKRVSCSEMKDLGLAEDSPDDTDDTDLPSETEMRNDGVERILKKHWSEPDADVDDVDGCVKDIAR
jgi:hypothetical protein